MIYWRTMMPNIIESVDIQRAIRAGAYKKAAQLYSGKNLARGWPNKPTENQIRGVFRIGYSQLAKKHPRTTWLDFKDKPDWISKLDYCAARGGKPLLQELLEIIQNIGGRPMDVNMARVVKYIGVRPPDPPLEFDDVFNRAIEFLGDTDE